MKPRIFRSVMFLALLISSTLRAQQWKPIASMHDARVEAATVTLLDGRVLIAGGHDDNSPLSSAEIFDARLGTWKQIASMHEARWRYPMLLLSDGRVMVAGGLTGMDYGSSVGTTDGVEIYDPSTDTWTQMQPMGAARENFPLLLLSDGRVFVCGGLDANSGRYLASTEIFDPTTNVYQELASMPIAVFGPKIFYDQVHEQILLQGGSYNGVGGTYPPILQIYDLNTDAWHNGPASSTSHDSAPNHVEMPDGTIVCLGGRTGSYECTAVIEELPPPYSSWRVVGNLTSKRWQGVSVICGDSILVIGGDNVPGTNPGTRVFDSTNWFLYNERTTSQGPRMIHHRGRFCATITSFPEAACQSHKIVFVFGGVSQGGHSLDSCEMLDLGVSGSSMSAIEHRSMELGVCGSTVDLPLMIDMSDTALLRSVWPSVKSVSGTFSYDSSRVYYNAIVPAPGWKIGSAHDDGQKVSFTVLNQTAAYSDPLNVASARFKVHDSAVGMTVITLNTLGLNTGTDEQVCITQNEDAFWALTIRSGSCIDSLLNAFMETNSLAGIDRISPNPASDKLLIHGFGLYGRHAQVFDALGRSVSLLVSIASGSTERQGEAIMEMDVHILPAGMYYVRIGQLTSRFEVRR